MNVGLLMVAEENDILARVLEANDRVYDVLFVLDGTSPERSEATREIVCATGKCKGYWTDDQLPRPPYPVGTTCGYRGYIYDRAVEALGTDHMFLELHGDEVWQHTPAEVAAAWPTADGFGFRLPFYFPREPWVAGVHALDQLRWHMRPGWPEFRMFRGSPYVSFDPAQHFNTQPSGLINVVWTPFTIKHYPYRAPEVQRRRAAMHEVTKFDPGNYQHIVHGDAVYWTDAMIEGAMCEHHTEVACG